KKIAGLSKEELAFATEAFNKEQDSATINQYGRYIFICFLKSKKTDWQTGEACRKAGAGLQVLVNKLKCTELSIDNFSARGDAAYLLAEGIALANYQFLKYRSEAKKIANTLTTINFSKTAITVKELNQ